jgi:hypothetical protein
VSTTAPGAASPCTVRAQTTPPHQQNSCLQTQSKMEENHLLCCCCCWCCRCCVVCCCRRVVVVLSLWYCSSVVTCCRIVDDWAAPFANHTKITLLYSSRIGSQAVLPLTVHLSLALACCTVAVGAVHLPAVLNLVLNIRLQFPQLLYKLCNQQCIQYAEPQITYR